MKIIILAIVLFVNNLYSMIELRLLDNQEFLRLGRISKVIIHTNNKEFLEKIKNIKEGTSLGSSIYFYGIEFIEENTDVSKIGAMVILKEIPQKSEIAISIDKKTFNLNLTNIKFHPDDAKLSGKKLIFLERFSFNNLIAWLSYNLKTTLFLFFIFVLVSAYFILKFFKIRKAKQAELEKIKFWKNKIKESHKRVDIEYLYAKKNEWAHYFPGVDCSKLFGNLKSIQYSREWTEKQFEEMRKELENLQKLVN